MKTILPELQFSNEEAALAENISWLLTKHTIIQKVYRLFGSLSEEYQHLLSGLPGLLPESVSSVSPKIYKGEQYRMLPYVMMDFPRFFQRSDVLAIRSLFWWGNHFSVHLLLGGKYKTQYTPRIKAAIAVTAVSSWYSQVTDDPWEHHFEPDNYLLLDPNRPNVLSGKGNYLKLGAFLPVQQAGEAPAFFTASFKTLLQLLNSGQ